MDAIGEYFGCGYLQDVRAYSTSNPQVRFVIDTLQDHLVATLPHFDRYPLRSKKADDYAIFREGVLLMQRVNRRGKGGQVRWTSDDIADFFSLKMQIEEVRRYKGRR